MARTAVFCALGSRALFGGRCGNFSDARGAGLLSAVNQAGEIVAVGAIGAKQFFVEEAFYAAAGADLIGISLRAERPAHFAVPATAKNYDRGCGNTGHHQPQRPQPIRLLFHCVRPAAKNRATRQGYAETGPSARKTELVSADSIKTKLPIWISLAKNHCASAGILVSYRLQASCKRPLVS